MVTGNCGAGMDEPPIAAALTWPPKGLAKGDAVGAWAEPGGMYPPPNVGIIGWPGPGPTGPPAFGAFSMET